MNVYMAKQLLSSGWITYMKSYMISYMELCIISYRESCMRLYMLVITP